MCGLQYSTTEQAPFCSIPHPLSWPPVMQTPNEFIRAEPWAPDAVMFHTGQDTGLANAIASFMFSGSVSTNFASSKFAQMTVEQDTFRGEVLTELGFAFGASSESSPSHQVDPAFVPRNDPDSNLFVLNQNCSVVPDTSGIDAVVSGAVSDFPLLSSFGGGADEFINSCVNTLFVLSDVERINRHFFCSFDEAKCNASVEFNERVNRRRLLQDTDAVAEYSNAWDFKASDNVSGLEVDIWYKDTDTIAGNDGLPDIQRVNLPMNLASNSWVKAALDGSYSSQLLALVEFPLQETKLRLDLASFLSVLLFTWVIQLFLPLMLVQLVYEKANRLRIIMKMHGLGDAAYWIVNYAYYLLLYIVYIGIFVAVGSAVDLAIFRLNDYGVQLLFYFLFGNVQIAFSFLLSSFFQTTLTAMVFSFLWVFGTGLLGNVLLVRLIERDVFYVKLIQLIPAFGAYRGWYELGQHSFRAAFRNSDGLSWSSFTDDNNDMDFVMILFVAEWPLFMIAAWYIEQIYSTGTGVHRHPLYFLDRLRKQKSKGFKNKHDDPRGLELQETALISDAKPTVVEMGVDEEEEDVAAERRRVESIPFVGDDENAIIIRGLRKVFPSAEGNPPKVAVKDLYMAVRRGEVVGLLGPNGAGKTTAINMLVGFMEPTSGSALIDGLDITESMDLIYDRMGVCPQHNLLWDTLTGAEHLLFYGRLKGLSGPALKKAVANALNSVHLFSGDGDRLVQTYSGGMKRRLSVAISLIGDPKVVYLDEPSTGLDPASRRNLWDAVKQAKKNKAIILTTHSMQEAGVLCDRLGIFVNGSLMVIGKPQQLTSRYGDYLIFTITTVPDDNEAMKGLVFQHLAANAQLTYEVGGTLIYEVPTASTKPSDVFTFVENAKSQIKVLDWAVTNATLEEVFMKVAAKAGATSDVLN
ncbi:unnamed protein product [Ostreobium quekettii]|uniref:ABC transporter domain-containing protein n=1 Tax=Ostreobium quekettii TaxID=121088 RepID=A0A8S1ITW2_9CHLO|nr:unnamed protein product [Ostreobium quekettii]|eukprot:evm.model.scf_105.6 EVM.evm.TU.scf_105.6   scf_105:68054-80012(+)